MIIELFWWLVAGKRYTRSMRKVREEEGPQTAVIVSEGVEKDL